MGQMYQAALWFLLIAADVTSGWPQIEDTLQPENADGAPSHTDFVAFVKFLLQRSGKLYPEPVPCGLIDPLGRLRWSLGSSGESVVFCSLCPAWPHVSLYSNILLDREPAKETRLSEELFGAQVRECLNICAEEVDCLALSVDHVGRICYRFAGTGGTLLSHRNDWTTLVLNQPTEVIRDEWFYSRHTRVQEGSSRNSSASNLLDCLQTCDDDSACSAAQFHFQATSCQLFESTANLSLSYEYGFVSGFRRSAALDDVAWRFLLEDGPKLPDSRSRHSPECPPPRNASLGSFYRHACAVQGIGAGCEPDSGCQTCYYPEAAEGPQPGLAMVICADSDFITVPQRQDILESCLVRCLASDTCQAVLLDAHEVCEFHNSDIIGSLAPGSQLYSLQFPPNSSKFSPAPGIGLSNGRRVDATSQANCLRLCYANGGCEIAAFESGSCRMGSWDDELEQRSGATSFFRHPRMDAPQFLFHLTPGWVLSRQASSLDRLDVQGNSMDTCLRHCFERLNASCQYVSVLSIDGGSLDCTFFGATKDATPDDYGPRWSSRGRLFSRAVAVPTLEALDRLPLFQDSDFPACFAEGGGQSEAGLANYTNLFETSGRGPALRADVRRRQKRGFFGDVWGGIKKIAAPVVAVVKETVETAVDTVKGVAKATGSLLQGDVKGAFNAVRDMQIVKDIEDTVTATIDLGKAIAAGDFDAIKNAALDLATSKALDLALGPLGKVAGKLGRIAAKAGRKAAKNARKIKNKIRERVKRNRRSKSRRKKKGKDGKDKHGRSCRGGRRGRRATKRKRPGDGCDDDDDEDERGRRCDKPKIKNAIQTSVSECGFARPGKVCSYDCKAGYAPSGIGKMVCQAGRKGKRPEYGPKGTCRKEDCILGPNVPRPLIPVSVRTPTGAANVFLVHFDKKRRLPIWSMAYHDRLNSVHTPGLRLSSFYQIQCSELSGRQGKVADYRNSGWDRGHLTPLYSLSFSPSAAYMSHLFVNVAPQDPVTNQQPWQVLEFHADCFLGRHSGISTTGVCPNRIGRTKTGGGLEVPACYWKLLCYRVRGRVRAVGFVADNDVVKTGKERERRAAQIARPISVTQLLAKVPGLVQSFLDTRVEPALYKGRLASGILSTLSGGGGPPTLKECLADLTLDGTEARLWSQALSGGNPRRRRRAVGSFRGCSASESSGLARLLGLASLSMAGVASATLDVVVPDLEDEVTVEPGTEAVAAAACGKRVVGYYPSWGTSQFSGAQASKLTHLVYAFLEMKADGRVAIGSADPTHSTDRAKETDIASERLEQVLEIRDDFPHLKLQFAVGGWENSQYFSAVAAEPRKRLSFLASVVQLISLYDFDGVDLDWEYPVTGGAQEGVPDDKANYVALMRELRETLTALQEESERAEPFLITFAGAAGEWTLGPGFDLPGLLKYADWVNVMTYDYFGAWASKWGAYTGPPAPLFFAMPPRFSGKTNVDFTIKYYVCRSERPHQITMGVPFYGRFWKNLGQRISPDDDMWRRAEAGTGGVFEGGYEPWKDIRTKYLNNPAFAKYFHDKAKTPYAVNEAARIFLGYEDPRSLRHKVEYAAEKNLGGVMVWAVDQDDEELSMLSILADADLCRKTNADEINFRCSPLKEKRWWTWDDSETKAGMCGRSAPLFKGFYPLCDPDDPGYSCCGPSGFCGTGAEYCDCPTCLDYAAHPERLIEEPIRPTINPAKWHLMDAPDGSRGRCGRSAPKIRGEYPICNPDDGNLRCCSSGGYCGVTAAHCECDGCIDFTARPDYVFPEKTWWDYADGADKSGRCGPSAPPLNDRAPQCDADSSAYCCSKGGFCGGTSAHCDCQGCVNFKTSEAPCCAPSGYCGGSAAHCNCRGCVDYRRD